MVALHPRYSESHPSWFPFKRGGKILALHGKLGKGNYDTRWGQYKGGRVDSLIESNLLAFLIQMHSDRPSLKVKVCHQMYATFTLVGFFPRDSGPMVLHYDHRQILTYALIEYLSIGIMQDHRSTVLNRNLGLTMLIPHVKPGHLDPGKISLGFIINFVCLVP